MITRVKSSRIITPNGFFDGYVYWEDGTICAVTAENLPFDKEYEYADSIVSPGFIDLHVHGGNGTDFCSTDVDGIANAAAFHLRHGTTTMLPTITSVSMEATQKALTQLETCVAQNQYPSRFFGAHLEGPYFSPKQCGAQNPDALAVPVKEQYEPLVQRFGKVMRRWSYAPELDKEGVFADFLTKNDILPSMGHSDAVYEDCLTAFENGCRMVTHLYSCTSTITRHNGYRKLGVLETAYLLDDMDVEMIADGKHLPPELIRLICKIKGYDRVCLVTDAMKVAGTSSTESEIGGVPCIIEDGVAKLRDRSAFAGSIATADRLLRVCVKDANIPLLSAVKMITETPARILGANIGKLEAGAAADLVVFDDEIQIQAVFANGKDVPLA